MKLVSADDVVRKMDNGLDSEVGEGGDLLSTGEKQLLSFARALLADPKILVLDEATSSIDLMTEHKIQDAIRTVIAGRTSFVVAHRLSTIVGADVILAVKDGKIVEQGTHHELMRRHPAVCRHGGRPRRRGLSAPDPRKRPLRSVKITPHSFVRAAMYAPSGTISIQYPSGSSRK